MAVSDYVVPVVLAGAALYALARRADVYAALTDGPELKTGTDIKVVDVVSSDTLLVEELNSVII